MKIFTYIIIIFLTPFLILLNLRLLIFDHDFYKSEFAKVGTYENFESREIVDKQSKDLITYLCCDGSLDTDFYAEREIVHMRDVKNLISTVNVYLLALSTLLIISCAVLIAKKRLSLLFFSFKTGTLMAIVSLAVVFIISQIDFDFLFLKFHVISFDNDLWVLPENANLIQLFPQQFFADFANRIVLQTLAMSTSILIFSSIAQTKIKK
ncbi:MAG: DUF1461 domain-containing protein [Candidatus Curtissbacteria bacterium]|nr:DUF1461 domain-containing protein [Candidatus Berkelbacteria bacterium]MCR4324807.1 DUF1461 domain-containing protein [Candidatus Curtissbacteria bacterium]